MKKIMQYLKTFMGETKTMFKEFFNKKTNKKQRANMWSFTRLIVPIINLIPLIIGLITGSIIPYIVCIVGATFGAFTDFLDGRSARKYNSYSEYGKKLDQVSDKFYTGITGISICLINPLYMINIGLEAIIGLLNAFYFNKRPYLNYKSLQIGRIKTWPLMISLAFGFLSTINPIMFFISIGMISFNAVLQVETLREYITERQKEDAIVKSFENNQNIDNLNNYNVLSNQKRSEKILNINYLNICEINDTKRRLKLINDLNLLKHQLTYNNSEFNIVNKQFIKKK